MSGVYEPDEGEIFFEEKNVVFDSPAESRKLGVEVIYQDMALVDELQVWENIFLGKLLMRRFLNVFFHVIDRKKMQDESERLLQRIGIGILSPKSTVGYLSGGQKKAIAIARAIYWNARIIIMDEPTAALGVVEVKKVLELIKLLKKTRIAVVFISHNLQEIFSTVDRIVVLHRGRVAGVRAVDETNQDEIIRLIMGEKC